MINYDEKMVLNGRLVIKMGIDQIGKNFVKSMSVKKFSYLGQFILGLRRSDLLHCKSLQGKCSGNAVERLHSACSEITALDCR